METTQLKLKKKPAAKLEQIIIPGKDTKQPTVCPGLQGQCNATGVSGITKDAGIENTVCTDTTQISRPLRAALELGVGGTEAFDILRVPAVTPVESHLTKDTLLMPPKQLKKRGRKRKIPIDEKYTNPDYIVMWPEICMAQKVLIDRYDNVYTYDLTNPVWLGVKTVYGKIDNVTYAAPLTKYYFQ